MTLAVEVSSASRAAGVPGPRVLRRWAGAAAGRAGRGAQVCLRVVGPTEARRLNRDWRGRDYATNVLSFPAGEVGVPGPRPLGDIVICASVVAREARTQGKSLTAHWAHLVVHGVLHLLGHDHEDEGEARRMERREVTVLRDLGFPNPYRAVSRG